MHEERYRRINVLHRDQLARSRSRSNLIQDLNIRRIKYSFLCYLFHSPRRGFPGYLCNLCRYLIKMMLAHLPPSDSWTALRKGESWVTSLKYMAVRPFSSLREWVDLPLCIASGFSSLCLSATHARLPYIRSSVVLKLVADNFPKLPVISNIAAFW